jgi:uncharacterized protein
MTEGENRVADISLVRRHRNNSLLRLDNELLNEPLVLEMANYCQHGRTSTLEHVYAVAHCSLRVSRFLRIRLDENSLIRGALLHDFYLYDWHIPVKGRKLHGFSHPDTALRNAKEHFRLNEIEINIISSHMWPLTLRRCPRYRESLIVCLIDKYCSFIETLGHKYNSALLSALRSEMGGK